MGNHAEEVQDAADAVAHLRGMGRRVCCLLGHSKVGVPGGRGHEGMPRMHSARQGHTTPVAPLPTRDTPLLTRIDVLATLNPPTTPTTPGRHQCDPLCGAAL